jgi:hypothetical protein
LNLTAAYAVFDYRDELEYYDDTDDVDLLPDLVECHLEIEADFSQAIEQ